MTPISFVTELRKINVRCSEFVSLGTPLYKALPWSNYGTIDRVKARFKKGPTCGWLIDELTQHAVCERYVYTRTRPYLEDEEPQSAYYMFPTNGFRSMWSIDHHNLIDQLDKVAFGLSMIQDVPDLKLEAVNHLRDRTIRYNHTDVACGEERELLVYNIPDFYVVHTEAVSDYQTLLEAIASSGP
jgi:hypothetical protein